jgi:hypothetical protein
MKDQRFSNLPADRHPRVERRKRILEDHRNARTAKRTLVRSAEFQKIDVIEKDRPDGDARRVRQQAEDRQTDRTFS